MPPEMDEISPMVAAMAARASTASLVARWMDPTWPAICSVALDVWLARLLTSPATTAKPFPASPARAASMVAFSAKRLVWLAMSLIRLTTSPMLWASRCRPETMVPTLSASRSASVAMRVDCST